MRHPEHDFEVRGAGRRESGRTLTLVFSIGRRAGVHVGNGTRPRFGRLKTAVSLPLAAANRPKLPLSKTEGGPHVVIPARNTMR